MTTASKEDIQWPSFEWRRPATIPSWPTTISKTKRSASKPRVCFPSCYPCRKRGITPRAGWPPFAGRAWTASAARCGNWKRPDTSCATGCGTNGDASPTRSTSSTKRRAQERCRIRLHQIRKTRIWIRRIWKARMWRRRNRPRRMRHHQIRKTRIWTNRMRTDHIRATPCNISRIQKHR